MVQIIIHYTVSYVIYAGINENTHTHTHIQVPLIAIASSRKSQILAAGKKTPAFWSIELKAPQPKTVPENRKTSLLRCFDGFWNRPEPTYNPWNWYIDLLYNLL